MIEQRPIFLGNFGLKTDAAHRGLEPAPADRFHGRALHCLLPCRHPTAADVPPEAVLREEPGRGSRCRTGPITISSPSNTLPTSARSERTRRRSPYLPLTKRNIDQSMTFVHRHLTSRRYAYTLFSPGWFIVLLLLFVSCHAWGGGTDDVDS